MGKIMTSIDIVGFSGITPKTAPHLLPNQHATQAYNCIFETGNLSASPLAYEDGTPFTTTTRKSIYFYNKNPTTGAGYWFQRDTDVDFVRGPIANDALLRTYFTGDGAPKMTYVDIAQGGSVGDPYPLGSRTLGIAAPSFFTAAGPNTDVYLDASDPPVEIDPTDGAQIITTSYVLTYVSDLGEEGPPSPPTQTIERYDGGAVSISSIPVPIGGTNITKKRLYRIELNGVYQFVAEIAAATTTHTDNLYSVNLGEPLPSEGWIAPNSSMVGLTALPNGILAGFWGNTLAFSEPFMPHAWPVRNRLALDNKIISIGVSAYGLVVATVGPPCLVSGSTPSAMSQQKLDVVQACVSKRSMVDMGEFVIYASAEGLVAVGGTNAQVITSAHMTEEQWQDYFDPKTIHAYRWRDRYLGFCGTGAQRRSFTFHPSEGFREFSDWCSAAYLDSETGQIYMARNNKLFIWNGDSKQSSLVWASKDFHLSAANPFHCCKVDCDSYVIYEGQNVLLVDFYLDGSLVKTQTITSNKPFRLPVYSRYKKFSFRIRSAEGYKRWKIKRVQLSTSLSEIY